MELSQALSSYRDRINLALNELFASDLPKAGLKLTEHETAALEALKEFSLRPGKRLRGAMCLFCYESLGGRNNTSIINAALALEMVQNYLLIIDDVMDSSPARRGKPAVHKEFLASLDESDEHVAQMLAINVGLVASHLAQSLLLRVDEKPESLVEASRVMQKNIAVTVYGQVDDLYNNLLGQADEKDIIAIYERKSSYYSFIAPLMLGAALAGRLNDQAAEEIEAIGLPAGVGFQIQDDILGMFGEQKETGKTAMDDLREGKYTLLISYALAVASAADAAKIKKALGNKSLSKTQAHEIQKIVRISGALEAATKAARHYTNLSRAAIASSTILNDEAKKFMNDLLAFVTERNK